jgi:hypothetical protein
MIVPGMENQLELEQTPPVRPWFFSFTGMVWRMKMPGRTSAIDSCLRSAVTVAHLPVAEFIARL